MTEPRRAWPLVAASFATAALFVRYLAAGRGRLDFQGYAVGRDFINAWTAGHLVREDHATAVFDPPSFLAAARRLFDPGLSFHFWSYPPVTLLMVAPLGWTSYAVGLGAWTILGLVALAWSLRTFGRAPEAAGPCLAEPSGAWLVLLGPAALTNIGLGQNGAFCAAALIGGLALVDRRPWVAGMLLGLLVVKPQIALLLPVMVLAGRRWRVMGGAAASAASLTALSWLVYGGAAWTAFFAHTLPMQTGMLRHGVGPFQTMMPSAYMAARVRGLGWIGAAVAQTPFSIAAIILTWRAWRLEAPAGAMRAGVLMAATFIASPQAFNYDLVPAALAALLLWRRDRSVVGSAIVLLAWALPTVMAASVLPDVQRALRIAPVAPLILAALAFRLSQVAAQPDIRTISVSTGAQPASNT